MALNLVELVLDIFKLSLIFFLMLTYWYIVISLSNGDLLAGWHWAWTIPSKLVSVMVQRCTSSYDLMPGRFVRHGGSKMHGGGATFCHDQGQKWEDVSILQFTWMTKMRWVWRSIKRLISPPPTAGALQGRHGHWATSSFVWSCMFLSCMFQGWQKRVAPRHEARNQATKKCWNVIIRFNWFGWHVFFSILPVVSSDGTIKI